MKLRDFWILLFLSPILCIVVGIIFFAIVFDGNHTCFGTFIPTQADVAQNGWVTFPQSATNISWDTVGFQCIAQIKFDMKPEDLRSFLAAMNFYQIIFTDREDGRAERESLVIYEGSPLIIDSISTRFVSALRGNGRFNQNVRIDRTNPTIYHVSVVSNQWPYSTTRRYDATPGWFSNSITPESTHQ
ncbi:MAG: hypothetical protein GC179_11400 [Anaerolineaceae bacterium]|nr:hypothetical protein [Anaerolineaceae bacterium]